MICLHPCDDNLVHIISYHGSCRGTNEKIKEFSRSTQGLESDFLRCIFYDTL